MRWDSLSSETVRGGLGATNRITFVGHATVLLELGGVRLLTDPVLRPGFAHIKRHAAPPAADVTERIDAVLLSHLHADHVDLPSLRGFAREVRLVVPRGAGSFLRRNGFTRVEELACGEALDVEGVEVVATPAVHDGRRFPLTGVRAAPIGFVVRGPRSVYFAGDTDLFEGMGELGPSLDLALLPVWGWGPRIGSGHLNPERAARAAQLLRPRIAVPIHWGTFYPLGRSMGDRLTAPPREFADHVAELAPEIVVRVLEPGESLDMKG
jgi:L-ascorbate metabolism protein UlaG (beta-lactamase superfamily)